MKTFLHRAYEEVGKQMESGTQDSTAMGRMRFALWSQHKALQDWSQHPLQALAGNLEYAHDSLIESCFPEIVKDQSSDFSFFRAC